MIKTALLFVLAAAMTVGCSGARQLTFHVISREGSNGGRPLYVLLREVDRKDFLVEDYDTIAGKVYGEKGEETLLWRMLLPGEKKKVKIPVPETSDMGVYGLFTRPGNSWKLLIQRPFEKKYYIGIEGNNIRLMEDAGDPPKAPEGK